MLGRRGGLPGVDGVVEPEVLEAALERRWGGPLLDRIPVLDEVAR